MTGNNSSDSWWRRHWSSQIKSQSCNYYAWIL